jgi:N-acylneuraminate cytidylyltransferase
MEIVAVIPARAKSKRIKHKNVRPLGGKPLICWTIEAALASRLVDHVVVSSDIPDIERITSGYRSSRLQVMRRPRRLAGDRVATEPVVQDVLNHLGAAPTLEAVVTLLPTSPFRQAATIDECIRLFRAKKADAVATISRLKLKPGTVDARTGSYRLLDENTPAEMHKIPLTVCDNPAIYVTRPRVLFQRRSLLGRRNYAVELDKVEGHDINDEIDWTIAEALLKKGLVHR